METNLNLNPIHLDLISSYLQLTRYQQNQRVKSIDHCFTNLLNYKIREDDTYNGDEVIKLVQDLQEIVLDEVKTELVDSIHTNVLLVQQLLKQAEEWHLTLTSNISELENREKLNAIKSYDDNQRKNPGDKSLVTVSHKKTAIPIEDYGAATALKHEVVTLLAENDILKKKISALQSKVAGTESAPTDEDGDPEKVDPSNRSASSCSTTTTTRPTSAAGLSRELDKSQKEIEALMEALSSRSSTQDVELRNVEDAVERMRVELETSRRTAKDETEKLRQDLESREDKLRQVQSNLLLAEKELDKKFQATGAYANMKKILVQKNATIKNLRKKLSQLGGDNGQGAEGSLEMDNDENDQLPLEEDEKEKDDAAAAAAAVVDDSAADDDPIKDTMET